MRGEAGLTTKGQRRAQEILDAALRCLARDGFAGTSMQRVADEAGVPKRAVVYYYTTREGLFESVVQQVAGQLIERLESAISGAREPVDVVERGFKVFWEAITTDRALLAAWFGLQAESITNPAFHGAANYINERVDALVSELIDAQLARGRRLRVPRDALQVLILANIQGLTLQFLDRGDSPELARAIHEFQGFLSNVAVKPTDT